MTPRNFQIRLDPAVKLDAEGKPVTDETGQPVRVLRLVLLGNDANEVDRPFDELRPYISLEPDEAEKLLSGELRRDAEGKDFIHHIGGRVSTWLLGNDLNKQVLDTLRDLPDNRLRLIFSVHPKLRPDFDFTSVPIELLRPLDGQPDPYAVSERVASILHLLDKIGAPQNNANMLQWPLRVLVVRSNPDDLGGAVPRAIPFANNILRLCEEKGAVGPTAVSVDVMTKEQKEPLSDGETAEAARPDLNIISKGAAWDTFRQRLRDTKKDPYDILIYLGHGSVKTEGATNEGCLQFEASKGTAKEEVEAWQLVDPLKFHPIPLVLLVGCYTAAQFSKLEANKQKVLNKKTSEWVRGSQGVAQSLINSQSGVLAVIGMRYRLEMEDALLFIGSFFNSLLKAEPGDVEAAVHYARRELRDSSLFVAAWSAPVVFRRLRGVEPEEPVFSYLGTQPPAAPTPAAPACQTPESNWHPRTIFWQKLLDRPWSERAPEEKNTTLSFLKLFEDEAIKVVLKNAPLVMPQALTADKPDSIIKQPGEMIIVPIKLYGRMGVMINQLDGEVVIDREVSISNLKSTQELRDCGYKLTMGELDGQRVTFSIIPNGTGELRELNDIILFNVTIKLNQDFNVQCNISINGLTSEPPKTLCTAANAVIIPPP
jgi:hypothetical protein